MKSKMMFDTAKQYIPGGVSSPVRACHAVGCDPVFIERAEGSLVFDVDGRKYIDFVCSWGPMIAGHTHPDVIAALEAAMKNGTSFGAPTPLEIDLAKMVVEAVPSIEKVRFVNSGTEATMSAISWPCRFFSRKGRFRRGNACNSRKPRCPRRYRKKYHIHPL